MKPSYSRFISVIFTMLACLFFSQCASQKSKKDHLPAQWIFMEKNSTLYAGGWVDGDHCLKAMNGSPVYMEAVRAEGKEDTPYIYSDHDGIPYVGTLTEGDYILVHIPAGDLDKGSHVEIDAVIISNPRSPKYFIIEYLEDKVWKSVSDDLMSVPEAPELKYSFRCTGLAYGEPHEYTCVYQTITLDKKPCRDGLRIRFRAVGDYTCAGGKPEAGAHDGSIGFATFGYTGAYIADYGAATPTDTTEILCIGNSFTYFSNAPSMMKEIAWSQGHYFDVQASLKGGQTLGQHTTRVLTCHLAEAGGYDYVILQDQSQNPARYASDPVKHAHVGKGYMDLCSVVEPYSPDCKIVMEQTWAYPAFGYGGFNDVETFNRLLKEGAEMMASQNGGMVSPIGDAFQIIWDENRDIRLYDSDAKHQSHYGSYLKACVNYLMITGEPFCGTVADCGLESWKAATLRAAAEKAVSIR